MTWSSNLSVLSRHPRIKKGAESFKCRIPPLVSLGNTEKGTVQFHLSRDERECQFLFGVRIVLVGHFKNGVAAQVLDGVHGKDQVAQIGQVFQEGQFGRVLRCGACLLYTSPSPRDS